MIEPLPELVFTIRKIDGHYRCLEYKIISRSSRGGWMCIDLGNDKHKNIQPTADGFYESIRDAWANHVYKMAVWHFGRCIAKEVRVSYKEFMDMLDDLWRDALHCGGLLQEIGAFETLSELEE